MEWLAFERFAATWKDYEAAYGYQEMFYWKMGRAGLCFVVTGACQRRKFNLCFNFRCGSLDTVECMRGTSCPSLSRNQGRGAEKRGTSS